MYVHCTECVPILQSFKLNVSLNSMFSEDIIPGWWIISVSNYKTHHSHWNKKMIF